MKTIYIVGGNGFARECYFHLTELSGYNKEFVFGGFLGHGGYGHTVDYKSYQNLYKGEVAEHKFDENDYFIIGAGYPELRLKIYNDLKSMGAKFFNLITEDTILSSSAKLGEANIIVRSSITTDVEIGNGNVLNGFVIIGHDCNVGDFNFFGPRSQVLGSVKMGSMNTIGANAILLPNSKIGDNNKIAPLSAVYKGCKSKCYLAGNPALKVGNVE